MLAFRQNIYAMLEKFNSLPDALPSIALAFSVSLLGVTALRPTLLGVDFPLLVLVSITLAALAFFGAISLLQQAKLLDIDIFLILIFFVYVFRSLFADNLVDVLLVSLKFAFGIVIFFVFSRIKFEQTVFFLFYLFFSSITVLFYIYNSYFVLGSLYLVNGISDVTQEGRNQFGLYLSTTSLLALSLAIQFWTTSSSRYRILLLLSAAIHLTALLYSMSRGAWVSFVVCFLGSLLLRGQKKAFFHFVLFLLGIAVFLSFAYTLDPDGVFGQTALAFELRFSSLLSFSDYAGDSILLREHLLQAALDEFSRNPVFGMGVENFSHTYGFATHNTYAQFLAEEGVVGLALFLFLIIFVLWRFNFSLPHLFSLRFTVIQSALICYVINIFFINFNWAPMFFVLLGLFVRQHYIDEDV